MSQSPNQADFFDHLNAPSGLGVFLFPPTYESKEETFNGINATINALNYLETHLGESKIKARNAKGVSRILDWLANYKHALTVRADALRPEINGQIDGRLAEEGVATTLNGHAE